MTSKIKDRWINAGISVLAALVIVASTSFIGRGDARTEKINDKADITYVDRKDEQIKGDYEKADADIKVEMGKMEDRFNDGDDRILEQMSDDKKEIIEIIKMNR